MSKIEEKVSDALKREVDLKKNLLKLAIQAHGDDVTPPEGLQEQALEALHLECNRDFDNVMIVFEKLNNEEKFDFITGLIFTQLRPTQMLDIIEKVHIGVNATISYLHNRPEAKKETSKDDEEEFSLLSIFKIMAEKARE